VDDAEFLVGRFEEHRPQLRAVAYRMLGSLTEADDAVQEAWLRLSRADATAVDNLGGWLTTVVARICLNALRSRDHRREEPLDPRLPDPVVGPAEGGDPEQEALVADAVGLALLVVLQNLAPTERLVFVLHDMFAVPFDEIAAVVDRTPAATRQLASRARRRVRGVAAGPSPEKDRARQREVVDAFLAAAREGDLPRLVAVLDPEVVLRADTGAAATSRVLRGADAVAGQALLFARLAGPDTTTRPVRVNGTAGQLDFRDGQPSALLGFTVAGGRITAIDVLADPERLAVLDLSTVPPDDEETRCTPG
jgi:RNA polymerase sigma-70 factor (ECF subfamily)